MAGKKKQALGNGLEGMFGIEEATVEKKEDVFCGEGGEGVWYNFSVYARVINNKVKVDSRAEITGG